MTLIFALPRACIILARRSTKRYVVPVSTASGTAKLNLLSATSDGVTLMSLPVRSNR